MEDNSANNTLDRLRKRIDALSQEKPSHKEVLQFLKELMTEQYRTRTSTKTVPVKIDGEKTQALIEGNPLLDKKNLSLDVSLGDKPFQEAVRASRP